jgi:hypothetical protein
MLTTAEIIVFEHDIKKPVGYTDMVKIYMSDILTKDEFSVILKHEQAHILLEHTNRFDDTWDFEIWNYACDMEIARNIYTTDDENIIKRVFSNIKNGIVSDSFKGLPKNIIYAEDIYEWLVNNEKKLKDFKIDLSDGCEADDSKEKFTREEIKEKIELAKKAIEEHTQSQIAEDNTKLSLEEIKSRPPSLTEEIEAALRFRLERHSSYRRPSRRGVTSSLMMKGKITTKNPPLVEIFVDRSSSFSEEKTKQAENKLKKILNKYGTSIKYDVWFFGDGELKSKDDIKGGDTPYHLIYKHLIETKPKMAIVITDDDPVHDSVEKIEKQKIVCVPIGCKTTELSSKIGGKDVVL